MSPRTLRSTSILIGLLSAVAAIISWSQPWYIVSMAGLFEGHPDLEVAGDVSAPAVAALALASAAGFAALAISGPFFRFVLAVLELALGACVILSAAIAMSAPTMTVAAAVTEATGLDGTEAVSQLIGSNSPTVWPYVALAAGVLLTLISLGILITGRFWPGSARRYEPVRFEAEEEAQETPNDAAVSNWDELSGGSDPTSR